MKTVIINYTAEAKTEYTPRPAVIRIRVNRKPTDELITVHANSMEIPADVLAIIERRLRQEWSPIVEQEIDPDDMAARWAAHNEAEIVMNDITAEASARLTAPVFEAYREAKGHRAGYTFYLLKDSFGYDMANRVHPKG